MLSNFLPVEGAVQLRRGSERAAQGLGSAPVESLFRLRLGTTDKLYAACAGSIFDVTPTYDQAGNPELVDAPAALGSGYTSDRWVGVNFGTRSIWANGVDTPVVLDGSTVAVAGFMATGLNVTHLHHPTPFKRRLFFAEKDSAKIWYGGVDHITGNLESIDLSFVNNQGGNVAALGHLTLDSGVGINDLLAIIFETGTVLMYQGTDPSSADTWSQVADVTIPPPVGDRAIVQLGGDVVVATQAGYVPLLPFLRQGATTFLALSDTISELVTRDIAAHAADNPGWDFIVYPARELLLCNVPTGLGRSYQYVQHLRTGAWSVIDGWSASSFAMWERQLYFGGRDGVVYRADVGGTDDGAAVVARLETAPSALGLPYENKLVTMARVGLSVEGDTSYRVAMRSDFDPRTLAFQEQMVTLAGARWDEARWNEAEWVTGETQDRTWLPVSGYGEYLSVVFEVRSVSRKMELQQFDVEYSRAGQGL